MGPQQVTVMVLDAFYSMVTPLSCFGRRAQPSGASMPHTVGLSEEKV